MEMRRSLMNCDQQVGFFPPDGLVSRHGCFSIVFGSYLLGNISLSKKLNRWTLVPNITKCEWRSIEALDGVKKL